MYLTSMLTLSCSTLIISVDLEDNPQVEEWYKEIQSMIFLRSDIFPESKQCKRKLMEMGIGC